MRPTQKFEATIETKKGFYIGDLCYAMKDEVYDRVWGDLYNYEDGAFEVPAYHTYFIVSGTAYGDGYYSSMSGANYPVDAGIIGICPLEMCDEKKLATLDGYGQIFEGSGSYRVEVERDSEGAISITIDDEVYEIVYTGYEEDEYDDEDDEPVEDYFDTFDD